MALAIGLSLGLLDIHLTDDTSDWLFMGAAALLGFLQPKTSWLSVLNLCFCLYIVHVLAIIHGLRPPYVEGDLASAAACWFSLGLNSIGAFVGVLIRLFENRR